MANFFDQFDEAPKTGNFFDQFDEKAPAPKEESGFLRQVADVPLSIGRGAATGVRMIADAFGAGSGASEAIKGVEGYLSGLMSAQAKNDEQEIARIMKDAEDKGVLDQVKAGFKAFSVAPVDLLSQGLGTAAPAILGVLGGKVLGAGALGMGAISTGIGAGMGAGSAKGGIYEEVKAALKESGIDEAKAERAAIQAQEYGGKNLDQILLSAGLGGVAGRFGVESAAQRILTRAAAKEAGKGAAREVAEGAARTAVTESVPELLQGSQEQVAKNIALQREGFDVPTMRGVAGSGTLEALAGAGLGAVTGGAEAGLRRQARGEADRILAEEEKTRADAEQARLDAEAAEKAKIPPLALGAEGVFTPVALPDGSVAMTREELAQYEEQQFQKKYAAQEADKKEQEVLALGDQGVFKPTPLPDGSVAMTREDLAAYEEQQFRRKYEPQKIEQPPAPEPYIKPPSISGTKPDTLLGERADPLAGAVTARREAAAPKAEIPLADDYAFLQRERQRLIQQDQTPDTKKIIGRIDEQLGAILKRDIERLRSDAATAKERERADAEAAKTSVFAQEELPPVERREAVLAERDLTELQAKEGSPDLTDFELQQAKKTARMAGRPSAESTEFLSKQQQMQKDMKALEAKRNKIKTGGNLYKTLEGQLDPSEVSDIAPDIKKLYGKGYKPLANPAGRGTYISELVADGLLNDYLPSAMRPDSESFDAQASAEFLKRKLRTKNTKSEVSNEDTTEIDTQIEQLQRSMDEFGRPEISVAEVEPGEAASVERSATEQEVGEATDIRYQRSTTGGKSIGKQQTQSVVDAVKGQWANAPEVVVAESMDDPAIPEAVRAHNKEAIAKGAKGSPKGFFYKGKAYILADSMTSPNDAVETLFHESLGHYGLRGTFGPEMGKVLADVVKNRKADVEAKAKQYGLDVNSEKDMLEAAEEVLAEMAQTKPGLSFVKRAIAVIRNFLRNLGLPFKMSNEDIIQKYILPARAFVEKGERRAVEGKPAAMREPAKAPPTDSAAFKKWFGDSKVVDENGEPLVVYHGTFVRPMRDGEMMGDIKAFDRMFSTKFRRPSIDTVGSWFSTNPGDGGAEMYSGADAGSVIYPAYLSIKNPQVTTFQLMTSRARKLQNGKDDGRQIGAQEVEAYRTWLKSMGKDGIKIESSGNEGSTEFDNQVAWIALEPTQIKSATGNIGTYDPENADIRYQREAEAEPAKTSPTRQNIFGEPVLGTWSITVDPKMELQDGLIYKMLDKNIDVKRIVEAVKSTGKQIASQWNPYLQEELYHGRTANASQEFQDKEWLPLLQDMDKKGVTIGELEKYLLNRHAEEYNKLVAKRNPDRPDMQDGGSSVKTEDARKYLADLDEDTKAKYDELAKRIEGITKGTRKLLVDTGYEKADTIKGWEKAFPNYVPLMREEAGFDYNFGSFGTGRGFDVRRDFSRSAMGSKRNVVDIIGNVISARNNAIALTEKNRVAQAVYGLAVESPNPEFWMAINPDAEKIPEDAIDELRVMGLDEEAVNFLMKEPRQRVLDPKRDQIVSRVNTKLRENDYVLATRINGEKRYVFFNPKDPRSKRAATALKNLDAQDLGTALGMIAKVTRWMASVNTQYNPIFGPYNFLRDVQSAALQLSTTELAGQQKEIAASVVPSLRAIYSSLRKRRKGEAATGEMADLWKEFQKEGGQTGFKDNFSRTQDRTEALLNEMEKITEGKIKANARAVFDWLSDYNDSLENAVRLSAYKVAKEKFGKEGFSDSEAKQKAASLAKNLTVNFNRKGDVATQMGALYAFFNASMQGTARMIETLKGPTGKKIMAGGLLLGAMQAALLAAAGFDDEEPPEFIRSKNIVIPTGDGNYVAFPMPLGFHVIPGVSRILTEWTLSGFKDTARRVTDLTGLFLDAFNPIGNAGWSAQTLAPTFADPIVALFENKDWTGKPISKEDLFSLRPTPGYTRAREGANFLSTNLAEFLNLASGGTKHQPGVLSPTPEQIEYLVGQVFGGVGREAIKLATTAEKTFTGEELPPYKIPLYGRFVGETKSSAAESNKFYKNMEKLNRLDLEIKGRREDREPIGDFMRENPQARLLPMANKTYKDVQALRKRRAALVERDAPREAVQAVEKMITRKMQVLNDRVRAMEEGN